MKNLLPLVALVALAACEKKPEVVDSRAPDPNAAALANAAPVALPPSIKSQKTYRCEDNSLAYVTWLVGGEVADVKVEKQAAPVRLTSTTGSSPWTSPVGWTVMGDETQITLTKPGKGPQTCHV